MTERPDDNRPCDDDSSCPHCGGEGSVELWDHPEVWDEDSCSIENQLIACPYCAAGRRVR